MRGRRSLIASLGIGVVLATFASTAAAKLVADYRFAGDRSSSVAGAPELVDVAAGNAFAVQSPGGCERQVLTFPAGGGVALNTTGLLSPKPYTVIFQFQLAETAPNYKRLLGFNSSPPAADDGLYLFGGKLDWYDGSDHLGTTAIAPGEYSEVAFSYGQDGILTAYLNGVQQLTFVDVPGDGFLSGATLAFFVDDGSEESAGAISRLRVYDTALTGTEITNTIGCPAPNRCAGKVVTLGGDGAPNVLVGTAEADVIAGGDGNDTIRGLAGRDVLCGNGGRDKLIGGKGRDRLIGAAGRDICRGGKGLDVRKGCERGRG